MSCRVRFCGFTWRFAFLECTVTRTGIILYCIRISSAAFCKWTRCPWRLRVFSLLQMDKARAFEKPVIRCNPCFFTCGAHVSETSGSRFLQGAAALAVIVSVDSHGHRVACDPF